MPQYTVELDLQNQVTRQAEFIGISPCSLMNVIIFWTINNLRLNTKIVPTIQAYVRDHQFTLPANTPKGKLSVNKEAARLIRQIYLQSYDITERLPLHYNLPAYGTVLRACWEAWKNANEDIL